jgi:type II secretory ATPase GspE/PulE/Tfp pilus assembly ATPase PilB-like protein
MTMINSHAQIFAQLPGLMDIDQQIKGLEQRERRSILMADEGSSDKAPIEQLIRSLYTWAIVRNASDIHVSAHGNLDHPTIHVHARKNGFKNFRFEYESGEIARHWQDKLFRITGTTQGATTPEIVSTRFGLVLPGDFAQRHKLPLFPDASTYDVDVRVEYTKTYDGCAFVTRLLDPQRAQTLEELKLPYTLMRAILTAINLPSGLILTTGPTGSGKTTLQNAMLRKRNDGSCAIHTIEDPVEIALRGLGPIKQIQIGGNITFPRALRSSLRQDPDIILIGEIRDLETLDIALQAAATGHLVLATLHTNSSTEAFTRMLDFAPPALRADYAYRIASNVRLVLAQRLLYRYAAPKSTRRLNGIEQEWLRVNGVTTIDSEITETRLEGEPSGRVPLIEAITMTPEIQRLLRAPQLNVSEIYKAACDQPQFEPLAIGGVRAVQSHGATLTEALAVLEGNMDAQNHPSLRARLATRYNLPFQDVADVIDDWQRSIDGGKPVDIDTCALAKQAGVSLSTQPHSVEAETA